MENKWLGIVYIVIVSQLSVALTDEAEEEADLNVSDRSQVEVRAVFINCESEVLNVAPESEVTRFERDELFKHSVLKDCTKKLALTVKITSETGNAGDEYLPVEHVFDGSEKRVRLLDPYILRLRREIPRQAYTLRRLDTVNCMLTNDAILETDDSDPISSKSRIHRDVDPEANERKLDTEDILPRHSAQFVASSPFSTVLVARDGDNCDDNNGYHSSNNTLNIRRKRNERNIVIEPITKDNTKWVSDNKFYEGRGKDTEIHFNEFDKDVIDHKSDKTIFKKEFLNNKQALKNNFEKTSTGSISNIQTKTEVGFTVDESKIDEDDVEEDINSLQPTTIEISNHHLSSGRYHSNANTKDSYSPEEIDVFDTSDNKEDANAPFVITTETKAHGGIKKVKTKHKTRDYSGRLLYSNEKQYAVYEIGSPYLWHDVHVQLFEKVSTPEGKTVWNDLTKGETASVGSMTPEWMGQDLNVKYRSSDWTSREDFKLPPTPRLCLLAPLNDGHLDPYNENSSTYNTFEGSHYIVVRQEDIEGSNDDAKLSDNNLELESAANFSQFIAQNHHRIKVRSSKAMLKGSEHMLNMASLGPDKYLTLNHQQPLRAQIDLEARADENQLVRIGASGRISIAVSDNSRKTRSTLNLQVGNTGLAAARFRVTARDCYPLSASLAKNKNVPSAGPILIPPRHTRSLRLELPGGIPADDAHCSVSLINDDDESVAVRDVAIKKGDRCFCVWHCDCVCLSVDPKLMCREMDETRQRAAGLSTRDRARRTRSLCYEDVVPLNIATAFSGALFVLLAMGFLKAVLGLICTCIGTWGLPLLLRAPRKLDHYYEKSLRCRTVEYDGEGWPVHPDTKTRNVHLVSMPMEFVLNTVFFVCLSCIVICDVVKNIMARYSTKKGSCGTPPVQTEDNFNKDVFSSHDIQEMGPRWRRRRGLRRWMTPQAQELSTELWQKSFKISSADKTDSMLPLLQEKPMLGSRMRENRSRITHESPGSCVDSEQDDTDYVLTQMQKSRESLARSQKKISNQDPPSHAALHDK